MIEEEEDNDTGQKTRAVRSSGSSGSYTSPSSLCALYSNDIIPYLDFKFKGPVVRAAGERGGEGVEKEEFPNDGTTSCSSRFFLLPMGHFLLLLKWSFCLGVCGLNSNLFT